MDLAKFANLQKEQHIRDGEIDIDTASESLRLATDRHQWSESCLSVEYTLRQQPHCLGREGADCLEADSTAGDCCCGCCCCEATCALDEAAATTASTGATSSGETRRSCCSSVIQTGSPTSGSGTGGASAQL